MLLHLPEIVKNIGSFYSYKSAIVHGGTKKRKIALKDKASVKNCFRKAIEKAFTQKLFKKNELIEYLELVS